MRSELTDAVQETVDEALTELENIVDLLPPGVSPLNSYWSRREIEEWVQDYLNEAGNSLTPQVIAVQIVIIQIKQMEAVLSQSLDMLSSHLREIPKYSRQQGWTDFMHQIGEDAQALVVGEYPGFSGERVSEWVLSLSPSELMKLTVRTAPKLFASHIEQRNELLFKLPGMLLVETWNCLRQIDERYGSDEWKYLFSSRIWDTVRATPEAHLKRVSAGDKEIKDLANQIAQHLHQEFVHEVESSNVRN